LITEVDILNYEKTINEIKNIISDSKDILENVVDYLYKNFEHYSWIGIYLVEGNYLVLGPWKGPSATEHTKIPIGKGICGAAAATGKTELIADVNADTRYLSCFVSTKSEIVVPIIKDGQIIGEIDIDSDKKNAFTQEDAIFLEKIADMLSLHI
jgi:GAF domain-containing protein